MALCPLPNEALGISPLPALWVDNGRWQPFVSEKIGNTRYFSSGASSIKKIIYLVTGGSNCQLKEETKSRLLSTGYMLSIFMWPFSRFLEHPVHSSSTEMARSVFQKALGAT